MLILIVLATSVSSLRVTNFTHEGFMRQHVIQNDFEAQVALARQEALDELQIRPRRGLFDSIFGGFGGRSSSSSSSTSSSSATSSSIGQGTIRDNNPSPGLIQRLGDRLDGATASAAHRVGLDHREPWPTLNAGEGMGRASLNNPSSGLRDMVSDLDQTVRNMVPAIPKLSIPDPLSLAPKPLADLIRTMEDGIGKISDAIRDQLLGNCKSIIKCLSQPAVAVTTRSNLKEKLLNFQRKQGGEDEKALDTQFERIRQVKKALLANGRMDKVVEPADDGIFDSDILMTARQAELLLNELGQGGKQTVEERTRRSAIFFENNFYQKWDVSQPIPYVFDEDFAEYDRNDIKEALDEISSKTCIKFAEQRTVPSGHHINYVKYSQPTFCGLSYIGRTTPANPIYLTFSCGQGKGVALHETLHALGLAHEHVRIDRDQFIKIDWKNINPQYYDSFAISDPKLFSIYGIKYDYGSIMHYKSNVAAIKPTQPTMVPLMNTNNNIEMLGQRRNLSQSDVDMLNRLYCRPSSCTDQNVYCGVWAIRGVCTNPNNDKWMAQNCRKSCGLC